MRSDPSVSDIPLISTESASETIYHAISLFVGPNRAWTDHDVVTAFQAAGHEITEATVASWRANSIENRRKPDAPTLLKLCQLFGPRFTSKIIGRIGQGAHGLGALAGTPAEIVAALSEGTAQFAVRGVDGLFCHVDRAELEQFADKMIEILTPFSTKRAG